MAWKARECVGIWKESVMVSCLNSPARMDEDIKTPESRYPANIGTLTSRAGSLNHLPGFSWGGVIRRT